MYKKVAPILKPRITINDPVHLPNIKPPNNPIGEPNPKKGNTHKIVNIRKIKERSIKLDFFNCEK